MRLNRQVRGFVGSVKCSSPGLAELAARYRIADADIVALFLAKRLEIAERMDAGRLTEGQGQIEMVRALQEAEQTQVARRRATVGDTRELAEAQARAAQAQAQAAEAQRRAAATQSLFDA